MQVLLPGSCIEAESVKSPGFSCRATYLGPFLRRAERRTYSTHSFGEMRLKSPVGMYRRDAILIAGPSRRPFDCLARSWGSFSQNIAGRFSHHNGVHGDRLLLLFISSIQFSPDTLRFVTPRFKKSEVGDVGFG